jgi:hypothetical protein
MPRVFDIMIAKEVGNVTYIRLPSIKTISQIN